MNLELTKAKAQRLIELQNEATKEVQTQNEKLDKQLKRYARSLLTLTDITQQLVNTTIELAEIVQQNKKDQ